MVLTFIKCTVEYFPRIHLQNSSLDTNSLNNVGCITQLCVGALGKAELSRDFTTPHKAAGRLLGHFVGEGAVLSKHEAHQSCNLRFVISCFPKAQWKGYEGDALGAVVCIQPRHGVLTLELLSISDGQLSDIS